MGFDILGEQVNGEPYVPFATRQMCTFVRPHQAHKVLMNVFYLFHFSYCCLFDCLFFWNHQESFFTVS